MPPSQDTMQAIGELKGGLDAVQKSVNRLLDAQDETRRENAEHKDKIYEKIDIHAKDDAHQFAQMRQGIQGLQEQLTRQDAAMDAIESHGQALLDIEKRFSDDKEIVKSALASRELVVDAKFQEIEKRHQASMVANKTNKKWAKGMIAALVALETNHATDWKIIHVIGKVLGVN